MQTHIGWYTDLIDLYQYSKQNNSFACKLNLQ